MLRGDVWWVNSCEASIDLNGERQKAMADQIATVSKQRLKSKVGNLSREDIHAIERALRLQFDLGGNAPV